MTQYNVNLKVPGHVSGCAYVEVQASSLNEALKVAWESDWENSPLPQDINSDACKATAFPVEVWTEEDFTTEFTREQIDHAWAGVKRAKEELSK